MPKNIANGTERGKRAEDVAAWYFRLNQCLTSPFVLHDDEPGRQLTDADLLGVRFPHAEESLRDIRTTDDRWLTTAAEGGRLLFFIAEVKAGQCAVNQRWRAEDRRCLAKAISRLGFLPRAEVENAAEAMHNSLEWSDDQFALKFVSVGNSRNGVLDRRYRGLQQLTWSDIGAFLWERFHGFGVIKGCPPQWPSFGRLFAQAVHSGEIDSQERSAESIEEYVSTGTIALRTNPDHAPHFR